MCLCGFVCPATGTLNNIGQFQISWSQLPKSWLPLLFHGFSWRCSIHGEIVRQPINFSRLEIYRSWMLKLQTPSPAFFTLSIFYESNLSKSLQKYKTSYELIRTFCIIPACLFGFISSILPVCVVGVFLWVSSGQPCQFPPPMSSVFLLLFPVAFQFVQNFPLFSLSGIITLACFCCLVPWISALFYQCSSFCFFVFFTCLGGPFC